MPETMLQMKVAGTVVEVTPAREFNGKQGVKRVLQDYYFIILKTKKNNLVKVYFPVSTYKGRHDETRKNFVKVLNEKTGEWIDHKIGNPKLILGYGVEAVGDVKKEFEGSYYMNRVTSFKIGCKKADR